MTNQAQAMYALTLDQCVDLIKANWDERKRTVLAQGDMGNGKSSMLTTLRQNNSPKRTVPHLF